ncbi:Von Willebrand factor type A domain-containing protein [Rhizobium phage RHph_I1_18]|nr:Von Willebrand factor type A domain-containing protein [Rhizobium phage RHph_I1_18]
MNAFVNAVVDEMTTTRTENGAVTHSTSLNANVDLFFKIGALRSNPKAVLPAFEAAYFENRLNALRIALWARDIRNGAGERAVFHEIVFWLLERFPGDAVQLIKLMPQFGYFKEMLKFVDLSVKSDIAIITSFVEALKAGNGLAAKYTPRKGAIANRIRGMFQMTPKNFRRMLVHLSETVEQQMSAKQFDQINYSHVPSVAMKNYSKAFFKRDEARFKEFRDQVKAGTAKINAGALFPYDLLKASRTDDDTASLQWKALPDFVPEGLNLLPMIDVSPSMDCPSGVENVTAMDIAISIGLYLMERNKSAFKDIALTFDSNPKWIQNAKTDSLLRRISHIQSAAWGGSTNLERAFAQILDLAVRNRLKQEDLPTHLLVLSDMEFDASRQGWYGTTYQNVKRAFEEAGYQLPNVIFWNISRAGAARAGAGGKSVPVRAGENGVAMVSGSSPSIVTGILGGELSPEKVMLRTIGHERYDVIS